MDSEQGASDAGHARRGLASASEETRQRVARKGGIAPHQKRGLAAASPDTRSRVAKAGGDARALDREGLSQAGRRGGEVVKERYGKEFYREIGEKGGGAVKERYGAEFYSEIGKRGGDTVKQERGAEYYSAIGRKGGEARTGPPRPQQKDQPSERIVQTDSESQTTGETHASTTA
ncbi:MAG TPA: hypothetical protein VLA68_02745 [Nitrososphaera sp.]|nr:hypothetical protein [Nitrososphaera sp.]